MSQAVDAVVLDAPAPRWPGVVGVIGIVLAVLTVADKAVDLLVLLTWSEADWSRVAGAEIGRFLARVMPSRAWMAVSNLIWIGLAGLLLSGSVRLRRRLRSGVARCTLWAKLAIGWFAVEMVVMLWWFAAVADDVSAFAPAGWQGAAALGTLLAVALMLAYPVFLLVWFGRPVVREEFGGWAE